MLDGIGLELEPDYGVPYDLRVEEALCLDKPEIGDFGLLPVPPLTLQQLAAYDARPLDEQTWATDYNYDHFWVFGVPEYSVTEQQAGLSCEPSAMALDRVSVADLPDGIPRPVGPAFFGRLSASKVESVVGMSGGPVFGVRTEQDGSLGYRVVAVQSRWYERARLPTGSPNTTTGPDHRGAY